MDFRTTVKMKVYETIAETGNVPTAQDVATRLEVSVADVEAAFAELAAKRLLVLELGEAGKIRMAPPFSGVETPFLVRVGEISYFANCVWDALGVVASLGEDGVVEASDGQTGESMRLEVQGGSPLLQECAIHFAVPAAQWWDDIIHTRATMLLFRSEETVAAWCEAHDVPIRPILDLDQLWHLATAWYENRLTVESRRPAPDEMVEIFAGLGLVGPFWDPSSDHWRSAS